LAFARASPEGRHPACGHAVTIRPVPGNRNNLARWAELPDAYS
jgi:hypothetical protein